MFELHVSKVEVVIHSSTCISQLALEQPCQKCSFKNHVSVKINLYCNFSGPFYIFFFNIKRNEYDEKKLGNVHISTCTMYISFSAVQFPSSTGCSRT